MGNARLPDPTIFLTIVFGPELKGIFGSMIAVCKTNLILDYAIY